MIMDIGKIGYVGAFAASLLFFLSPCVFPPNKQLDHKDFWNWFDIIGGLKITGGLNIQAVCNNQTW
jgi:hypothetical protein